MGEKDLLRVRRTGAVEIPDHVYIEDGPLGLHLSSPLTSKSIDIDPDSEFYERVAQIYRSRHGVIPPSP